MLAAAAGAARAQGSDLKLHSIELVSTSGTVVLQRVSAREATLSEDGNRVLAKELSLTSRMSETEELKARAPLGSVVVSGPREPKPTAIPKVSPEIVDALRKAFPKAAKRGDIELSGGRREVVAHIGNRGSIFTSRLIWSPFYNKFILPEPIEQKGKTPDGAKLDVQAPSLVVDRQFLNWEYGNTAEQPMKMTIEGGK